MDSVTLLMLAGGLILGVIGWLNNRWDAKEHRRP